MISSLTGTLHQVDEDRIHLRVGPMVYEAMVPASDIALLQSGVGAEMTFHTTSGGALTSIDSATLIRGPAGGARPPSRPGCPA